MTSKNENKKNLSDIYVHFIDILFAVVLGQSFVLLNSADGFKPWLLMPKENAFGIATLLLVYGLVITSWIGYHRSTRVFPIKSPLRFVVDVILLFLYYMGFVNANNFESVSWVFFLTFLSYTVWDIIRVFEYMSQKESMRVLVKRLAISAVFAGVFFLSTLLYANVKNEIKGIEWAFFVVVLVLLILFRFFKWYKETISS